MIHLNGYIYIIFIKKHCLKILFFSGPQKPFLLALYRNMIHILLGDILNVTFALMYFKNILDLHYDKFLKSKITTFKMQSQYTGLIL